MLKHLLGDDAFTPGVRKSRASLEAILQETRDAVTKAASAEVAAGYEAGLFHGENKGARASKADMVAAGYYVAGSATKTNLHEAVVEKLGRAGFEPLVVKESHLMAWRRGDDEVVTDLVDGEWMYRTADETLGGDDLADLSKMLDETTDDKENDNG